MMQNLANISYKNTKECDDQFLKSFNNFKSI